MTPWAWWLVTAAALAVAEVFSLTLLLGLLAGAAVLTAVVALLGAPLAAQVAVFAVSGAVLTLGVRPVARRHLHPPSGLRTGTAALEGRSAVVIETVGAVGGRVKMGGETWAARGLDPTRELAAGTHVTVAKVEGATVVVYQAESL